MIVHAACTPRADVLHCCGISIQEAGQELVVVFVLVKASFTHGKVTQRFR